MNEEIFSGENLNDVKIEVVEYEDISGESARLSKKILNKHAEFIPSPQDSEEIYVARDHTGELIGSLESRVPSNRPTEREISYRIDPDHEGKGIATRLVSNYLDSKKNGEVTTITATVKKSSANSSASSRVLEKANFKEDNRPIDKDMVRFIKKL